MFEQLRALFYALLVHVALVVFLIFSVDWDHTPPQAAQKKIDVVQAVVVDESEIQKELEKLQRADQLKTERAQRVTAKAQEAERKRRKEEQRLKAVEKKRKAEERRAKALKKERQQRQAAERQKRSETQRLEAKQKRNAEEKKRKQVEAKRLAAERRRQVEAKKRRDAEARRVAELEAQRNMEAEQQRLAEERRRQAALDRRLNALRAKYVSAIAQKVERNWARPPGTSSGIDCDVKVHQIPGGEVINATVTRCNADAIVQRSIENAVRKASPLPLPPDPALFDRDLVFTFHPRD